jgi:hypothetical protein
MQVKVTFPNLSFAIMEEAEAYKTFNEYDDVLIEDMEVEVSKAEARLQNLSFCSVVGAIDAKFNNTYLDVTV